MLQDYIENDIPEIVWCSNKTHSFLLSMFHGLGNTKISKFKNSLIIDKNILWFDISVYNFVAMQIDESFYKLNKPIHDKFLFK